MAELTPRLVISPADWERMRADVAARAPQEACGLIAGLIQGEVYQALEVIPATNQLNSPVRFRIEPLELLQAFNHIEANGWELVAIYHSHPNGPEHPSETDLAEAYYPDALTLIWSPAGGGWQGRAFMLQKETRSSKLCYKYEEINLDCTER